jgi:hypothetical protein
MLVGLYAENAVNHQVAFEPVIRFIRPGEHQIESLVHAKARSMSATRRGRA